jgi:hypothetical protein
MFKGNGAREVLIEFLSIPVFEPLGTGQMADRLLAYLWVEGYKIVPLTEEDINRIQKDIDDAIRRSDVKVQGGDAEER